LLVVERSIIGARQPVRKPAQRIGMRHHAVVVGVDLDRAGGRHGFEKGIAQCGDHQEAPTGQERPGGVDQEGAHSRILLEVIVDVGARSRSTAQACSGAGGEQGGNDCGRRSRNVDYGHRHLERCALE
jgi:hypothetical protein